MARAGLDRNAVTRAAATLADTEGLDALSLARLAAVLGIKTPSLYNHVDSLAALRRDLAIEGLTLAARDMGRAAIGKSGTAALVAMGLAYRDFAKAHPGLHAASLAAPNPEDAEHVAASQSVLDVVMAVMAGFGLEGDDGYHAIRGLRAIIHGFVSLEAAGGFGMALDVGDSLERLLRNFGKGLGQNKPA